MRLKRSRQNRLKSLACVEGGSRAIVEPKRLISPITSPTVVPSVISVVAIHTFVRRSKICYTTGEGITRRRDRHMPSTMTLDEAQQKFTGIADFVVTNNAEITIIRQGRPFVRIMPARPRRRLEPDSLLRGARIADGDLFDDCSNQFEALTDA